jgi:hypothetical protein
MLPPKNGKPITFKPTKQLREQTEAIADSLGESLSDYVRKAVETYNTMNQQHSPVDSTHKNNTVSKPTIPELKEKVKEMEKPKMVQSFAKGGEKK